ncbi:MAG: flippase [Clostridia bacterium]|nr:flippase [Clostridia bacterium]
MSKNKVFNNAKWIIACKITQSILQFIVGMLCARYLGPSNYGIINYAASVVAFAVPIMQLGLPATIVKDLIENPESEGEIMGTSLVMDLISGLACIFLVGSFVAVANHNETEIIIVCILYSLSLILRAFELLQYWFQYKLLSKYPSIIMLVSYVVVSLYRIFLLVTAKSIYWFAVVNSVDYLIIGGLLLVIYKKQSSQKLSFSFKTAKKLFSRSKFYILSAMMVTLFQDTDHIMLKLFSGDAENGFYTAAITCACVVQFVYTAIIDSMRPVILECKQKNTAEYEKKLSTLYCIVIYMSLAQSVVFTLFAKLIVAILYGAQYMPTVSILRVLVWYVVFSYMGAVRNIWILAEGKHKFLWKINLAGALANILLNSVLIPFYGALGAAIASLVTQFFTNFILGFIIKTIRPNNRLLLKGLNPKLLLSLIKEYKK